MASEIPTFAGEEKEAAKFLKSFDLSLALNNITDDKQSARIFENAMEAESRAEAWFEGLTAEQRGSYGHLKKLFKEKFVTGSSVKVQANNLTQLGKMKLRDEDVGLIGTNGKSTQQVFADEFAKILLKCPKDMGDSVKTNILMNAVGPILGKSLEDSGKDKVQELLDLVRELSPKAVTFIRSLAANTRVKTQVQTQTTQKVQVRSTPMSPTLTGGNGVPMGRTQSNSEFWRTDDRYMKVSNDHLARLDAFLSTNSNLPITADSNVPLTPGTLPPGSLECFKCAQQGHLSRECPNKWVNPTEQRFRSAVSDRKRAAAGVGMARSMSAPGVRFTEVEEDEGFAWMSGNGFGLDL